MTLTSIRFRKAPLPLRALVYPTFNKALVCGNFAILEEPRGIRVKMPGWAKAEMSKPELKDLAGKILASWVTKFGMYGYKPESKAA